MYTENETSSHLGIRRCECIQTKTHLPTKEQERVRMYMEKEKSSHLGTREGEDVYGQRNIIPLRDKRGCGCTWRKKHCPT